jgi:integrase/recombinase XerD
MFLTENLILHDQLQKYLAVSDEQVLGAASSLSMLSPIGEVEVGK